MSSEAKSVIYMSVGTFVVVALGTMFSILKVDIGVFPVLAILAFTAYCYLHAIIHAGWFK